MPDRTQHNFHTGLKQTVDSRMREYLNYSQRCAYKALKRLTRDKDLEFEATVWEEASMGSRASTDRSIVDTDDKSDAAESESLESGTCSPESSSFHDVQKNFRETWIRNIDGQDAKLLKSDSDKSSMMPARSLARSDFSGKFAKYETWRSRSANILESIPKMLCFQRKKKDKCFTCMQKSLRKVDVSASRALLTEIEARDNSESSSDGFSEFYEEFRDSYLQRKTVPKYSEEIKDSNESIPIVKEEQAKEEEKDIAMSTKVEPNQSKSKTSKPTDNLSFKSPKDLKAISNSLSISSKISSSDAHTTDDDEMSSPLVMDNDPQEYAQEYGYKNMAPCYLPTILLPSMEPLRALKRRKPTTMESRIALMESATSAKQKSDDEHCDEMKTTVTKIPEEKSQLKRANDESDEILEKKDAFLKNSKALVKVRSEQQLIPAIVKPVRRDELKRGYSCASIRDLSKDSTRGTFEALRSEAKGGRGEAISLEVIDSASGSVSSDSPDAEKQRELLPLLTVAEISRFLTETNLKETGSAAIALESLADVFSARLIKQHTDADTAKTAVIRRAKLAARLTKLLADSKRYLNPDKFPSDLVFSTQQPPICNTRLLKRVLPLDSYNLIAPLLGMPNWYPKRPVRKVKHVPYRVRYVDEEEKVEEEESVPSDLSIVVCTKCVLDYQIHKLKLQFTNIYSVLNKISLKTRDPRRIKQGLHSYYIDTSFALNKSVAQAGNAISHLMPRTLSSSIAPRRQIALSAW